MKPKSLSETVGAICMLLYLSVLLFLEVAVIIFFSIGLKDSSLQIISSPSIPIIPGECVEIPYDCNEGSRLDSYSLLFSLPPNAPVNYSAIIYRTSMVHASFEPFQDEEPLKLQLNFNECTNVTCVFEIAAKNDSFLVYNITNIGYAWSNQEFQILVFDSVDPHSTPIRTISMDTESLVFSFNQREINSTSSYSFFSMKLVQGPPFANFTISRTGVRAQYNTSDITPYCIVDNATRECLLPLTNNELSVLVCIHNTSPEEVSSIVVTAEGPHVSLLGNIIDFVQYLMYFFLAINTCIIMCYCCIICIIAKRKSGTSRAPVPSSYEYNHEISIASTNSYTSDATNEDFSDTKQLIAKEERCQPRSTNNTSLLKWQESSISTDEGYTTIITSDEETAREKNTTSPNAGICRKPWMEYDNPIHFDQKGLFHHFDQCGVTIDIPEGAVDGPATLEFGTSRIFPGFSTSTENISYEPISSFIWIHVDTILTKPAKVYIPHWIQYDETIAEEVYLLVNHDEDDNAIFHVKEDTHLQLMNSVACVEMTSFCSACLAEAIKNGEPPPKRKYQVAVFERSSKDRKEKEIHVCLLHTIECLKVIESKYKAERFTRTACKRLKGEISSRGLTISTDLPADCQNWKHVQLGMTEKIDESDVDIYQVLETSPEEIDKACIKKLQLLEEDGSYPPRFKIKFYNEAESVTRQSVKISLHGFEGNPFSVTILLGDFDIGIQGLEASDQLEEDDVIVKLMPFLESAFVDSNSYFKFGHQLGLTVDLMSELEAKYPLDYGKCAKQILIEWRKNSLSPTYTNVTDALKMSDYPVLSLYILKKLNLKPELPSDFCDIDFPKIEDDLEAIREALPINIAYKVLRTIPSVQELNDVLYPHICNKWKIFGIKLGLGLPKLEAIEKDKGNCQDCFNELYRIVENLDHKITWEVILETLYSPSMKAYRAIEEIYKHFQIKYGIRVHF